jgi:hypothetical protein
MTQFYNVILSEAKDPYDETCDFATSQENFTPSLASSRAAGLQNPPIVCEPVLMLFSDDCDSEQLEARL